MDIPLIILSYNQVTYIQNLCLWFRFYYPENTIHIVDNASTYKPLLDWFEKVKNIYIHRYPENDCVGNLTKFLKTIIYKYYLISDADIMPHPATPPNFLEYFQAAIDSGFHRAGFDLIYDDIPAWNPKQKWIQGDQESMQGEQVKIGEYEGIRSPIDTTFCMYTNGNSGWSAPMGGKDWGNCLRIFKAFHLPFYLHKDYMNKEMTNYFNTVRKREAGKPSAGVSHFNPYNGMD